MLGCSEADCVGLDDAGKVVRVRRVMMICGGCEPLFLCLIVWKK